MAEHGSVQKEKVTEDYNDAYPLKILLCHKRLNISTVHFLDHQEDL